MGRIVVSVVAGVLENLLELGGNNAIIITPDADLDITIIGLCLVLWERVVKDVHNQKAYCSRIII